MLKKFSKQFNLSFSSCPFDAKLMVPTLVKWVDIISTGHPYLYLQNLPEENRTEFIRELGCYNVEISTFVFNFIRIRIPGQR